MLANYAVMSDLQCAGGFVLVDGFWRADRQYDSLTAEERWIRVSDIYDVYPVKGLRPGPDEPGYRITTRHQGDADLGFPIQYKIHLLQPPEIFLEFLGKCERDLGLFTLARLNPA